MKKAMMGILFLCVIGLTACNVKTDFLDKEFPLPQTAEIFLIDRYVNWAEGYFDSGLFVDTTGAVYSFDFSAAISRFTSDKQMFEMFDIIRENTNPVMVIDNDTLKELYSLGLQIAPESIFQSENVGCDGGSGTISFRNPDTAEMVVCVESGDDEGMLEDRFAEKLVELYQNAVKGNCYEITKTIVYTAEGIHLNCVECDTKINGKYFLSSDEQLRSFAEQTGVAIDDMLRDYTEYEWGRYVYFVELNAAPANAILCIDGSYKFSHTEGAGFCNVAAYPRKSSLFTEEYIPCVDGGEWQRIEDEPFSCE